MGPNLVQLQEMLRKMSPEQLVRYARSPDKSIPNAQFMALTVLKEKNEQRDRLKADAMGNQPKSTVQQDVINRAMGVQAPLPQAMGQRPMPPAVGRSPMQAGLGANVGLANGGYIRGFAGGGDTSRIMEEYLAQIGRRANSGPINYLGHDPRFPKSLSYEEELQAERQRYLKNLYDMQSWEKKRSEPPVSLEELISRQRAGQTSNELSQFSNDPRRPMFTGQALSVPARPDIGSNPGYTSESLSLDGTDFLPRVYPPDGSTSPQQRILDYVKGGTNQEIDEVNKGINSRRAAGEAWANKLPWVPKDGWTAGAGDWLKEFGKKTVGYTAGSLYDVASDILRNTVSPNSPTFEEVTGWKSPKNKGFFQWNASQDVDSPDFPVIDYEGDTPPLLPPNWDDVEGNIGDPAPKTYASKGGIASGAPGSGIKIGSGAPSGLSYEDLFKAQMAEMNGEPNNLGSLQSEIAKMKEGMAGQADKNGWMALATGALAAAAGKSQYALQNIAEGGLAGIKSYSEDQKDLKDRKFAMLGIDAKMAQIENDLSMKKKDTAMRYAQGAISAEQAKRTNDINEARARAAIRQLEINPTIQMFEQAFGVPHSKWTDAQRERVLESLKKSGGITQSNLVSAQKQVQTRFDEILNGDTSNMPPSFALTKVNKDGLTLANALRDPEWRKNPDNNKKLRIAILSALDQQTVDPVQKIAIREMLARQSVNTTGFSVNK